MTNTIKAELIRGFLSTLDDNALVDLFEEQPDLQIKCLYFSYCYERPNEFILENADIQTEILNGCHSGLYFFTNHWEFVLTMDDDELDYLDDVFLEKYDVNKMPFI